MPPSQQLLGLMGAKGREAGGTRTRHDTAALHPPLDETEYEWEFPLQPGESNLRIMAQALLPFFLNKLPNKGYAHHLCPMYISPNIFQSAQQSKGAPLHRSKECQGS